jgi:hypothetical protein
MQSMTPGTATSLHLAVRPDWLDRRHEEIIDPDLPIVDPHHHLVERPETGRYLLPDLLADLKSGHNVTQTVYLEWLSMYRADGPAELRPVGEVEFANGVAAMTASGGYGGGSAPASSAMPIWHSAPASKRCWRRRLRPAAAGFAVSALSRRRIPTRRNGDRWSPGRRGC